MSGLLADRAFTDGAKGFVLVRWDAKAQPADRLRELGVIRGSLFIVLLASDGRVLERFNMGHSGAGAPQAANLAARMKEAATANLVEQTDFLLHFLAEGDAAGEKRPDLEAEIEKLGDDDFQVREKAGQALLRAGPSACPTLRRAKSQDPEVHARVADLLAQVCGAHATWEARGLDHDVDALLRLHKQAKDERVRDRAAARLRAILPAGARLDPEWWQENRGRLRWDAERKKYLPQDGAPAPQK